MTSIGKESDIPQGAAVSFRVDDHTIAVARVDGQLYAFDDVCTHRGCSLSEGPLDGPFVTCPCHFSIFNVTDGKVVDGPASRDIATYPVQTVDGEIHVSLPAEDAGEAQAPPPAATAAPPAETAAAPAASSGAKEPALSALAAVPLFSGLDRASLSSLEAFAFRKTFQPGELIVEEGRTGNGLYVVLSGRVEVVKGLDRPNPQIAARLGPGEPFGEMALLGDWKRSASVRAIDEVECLGLDRWAFLAHLNREPQLAIKMLQMVAERLMQTNERLIELET